MVLHNVLFFSGLVLCGFRDGLKYDDKACDGIHIATTAYGHCETGLTDGEHKATSLTQQFKVGYILGKNDSIISVNEATDACKSFIGIGYNYSPEWFCETGYDKGYNHYLHVDQPGSSAIVKIYKESLP
jgi:hypothetical protein